MTKKTAVRKHREMWEELARSGDAEKPRLGITQNCWLCEYTKMECERCPLVWPELSTLNLCPCTRSYYVEWCGEPSIRRRRKLALKIANLKEKE